MSKYEERRLEWEIAHSSLAKKISNSEILTYNLCRKYACLDIVKNLTHVNTNGESIIEIPKGTEFHFIGRVDTNSRYESYNPNYYYKTFERREFISFSTINNSNISHYRGDVFLVYDILPQDIVHIFPSDSFIYTGAVSEKELTHIPSLWITLNEVEDISLKMRVYNQITCKTKRNGKILKPFAVISFNGFDSKEGKTPQEVANRFGIPCIRVYPNENAVNYGNDLLLDQAVYDDVCSKLQKYCGINIDDLLSSSEFWISEFWI